MASITNLLNPTTPASFSRSSSSSARSHPKLLFGPHGGGSAYIRVSPLKLSVQRDRAQKRPLVIRCSQLDGNGASTKKTTLHDLYEKQGQSPWYDNLCRPVTDLLLLIAKGVRGVTSNPTIFQKAISSSNAYDEQFRLAHIQRGSYLIQLCSISPFLLRYVTCWSNASVVKYCILGLFKFTGSACFV